MKKNALIILSFIFCFCTNSNNHESNDQGLNPNIIIIFMDDLGYGDIVNFGAIDYQTPNLNELANQGMTFTNFYSAQAVCSASRAALLTGCYPNRIGIKGALFPQSKVGLNENEVTIAEMLKEKGYSTAIFGKWHLGHQEKFIKDSFC